jgi:hypothetical protein
MDGATGAVTLIQHFGSALNVNFHSHILFLDGAYIYRDNRPSRFLRVKAPDKSALEELVRLISQSVDRCFERQGLLDQDVEVCGHCGGSVKVIACIENQDVIDRTLAHLRQKEQGSPTVSHLVPPSRALLGSLPLGAVRESTAANQ